jgi:hypothetical protein
MNPCALPFRVAAILAGALRVFSGAGIPSAHAAENYEEPATGLVFPDIVGPWRQGRVHTFDEPELGRSIGYNDVRRGAITVYIYTLGQKNLPTGADGDELLDQMRRTMQEVTQAWSQNGGDVREQLAIHRFTAPGAPHAVALIGAHTITNPRGTHTSITLLTRFRGHYLKLRHTRPESDFDETWADLVTFLQRLRAANEALLDPAFRGDTFTRVPVASDAAEAAVESGGADNLPKDVEIVYDGDHPHAIIWFAYCLARTADVVAQPDAYPAGPGEELVPTFEAECSARTTALEVYREMLAERKVKRDAYWQDLAAVHKAGYLREYVWTFHRRPEWSEQDAPPQLERFTAWSRSKLKKHQPITAGRILRRVPQ